MTLRGCLVVKGCGPWGSEQGWSSFSRYAAVLSKMSTEMNRITVPYLADTKSMVTFSDWQSYGIS